MQVFLALDIGEKRTGVSFAREDTQTPVVLPTVAHSTYQEFETQVLSLLHERNVTDLVVGLPLLLSGEEGAQAGIVQSYIERLHLPDTIKVHFLDERYSTPKYSNDPDAAAACEILNTYLRKKNI